MRVMHKRVSILGVAVLTFGILAAVPAVSSNASGLTHRTVTNTGHGYITRTVFSNGDSVQVYSAVPMTMNSSGPTKTLATSADAAMQSSSGVATPDLTSVPRVNGKPQLLRTPSAYDEVVALGAPPEIAALFKQLAPPSTATSSGVSAASTISRGSGVTPMSQAGTIISGNNCASASSDGGRIKMYGCDVTSRVGSSGAVWYLEDSFLATGTAHDTAIFNPDELTGLRFGIQYGGGNTINHWDPADTQTMGNCTQNTVSVTYLGATTSNTTTECPETFGVKDINATIFTAKWDGKGSGPSNASRQSHGVDSVYNGASASPYPSLVWTYWWA